MHRRRNKQADKGVFILWKNVLFMLQFFLRNHTNQQESELHSITGLYRLYFHPLEIGRVSRASSLRGSLQFPTAFHPVEEHF